MVGCEHRSAPLSGSRPTAILKAGRRAARRNRCRRGSLPRSAMPGIGSSRRACAVPVPVRAGPRCKWPAAGRSPAAPQWPPAAISRRPRSSGRHRRPGAPAYPRRPVANRAECPYRLSRAPGRLHAFRRWQRLSTAVCRSCGANPPTETPGPLYACTSFANGSGSPPSICRYHASKRSVRTPPRSGWGSASARSTS